MVLKISHTMKEEFDWFMGMDLTVKDSAAKNNILFDFA